MSSPAAADDGRKAFQKERRAELAQQNELLDNAVIKIDKKLQQLTKETAARLGLKESDVRAEFLFQMSARPTAAPNPWNGLVHEKSAEWSEMKKTHPGGAYMNYVVNRIHEEGLYQNLSDAERDQLATVAQKSRDDRVNAGAAKKTAERLRQGSAKNELTEIGISIDRLHDLAHVKYILLTTKGRVGDGLKPMYFVSPKAKTFIQAHLNVSMTHLLTMMESSVRRGPAGAAEINKLAIGDAKSELRRAILSSLQEDVVSTAEDKSPPVVVYGSSIKMVEYKNYYKNIRDYRVKVFGWPMRDNGTSMADPGGMGLTKMRELLVMISNGECGFKRLTQNELVEWSKQHNEEIISGKATLSTRRTRSDAGKKRKKQETFDMAVLVDEAKRKRIASKEKQKSKVKRPAGAPASSNLLSEPCDDEHVSQDSNFSDSTPTFDTQGSIPPAGGQGTLAHPAPVDVALIDPSLLALSASGANTTNAFALEGPCPRSSGHAPSPSSRQTPSATFAASHHHSIVPSPPRALSSSSRIASQSTHTPAQPSLRFRSHTPESYESYASRAGTRSRPGTPTGSPQTSSTRGGSSRSLRLVYADLG